MIYIIIFVIATLCVYIAEKSSEKNQKRNNHQQLCSYSPKQIILFALAVIILSFLAAIRDKYCGIDVTWYVTPTHEDALYAKGFMSFISDIEKEYGYYIIVYVITKLFDSLFFVHFFSHVIIIGPILYLLTTLKKEVGINISVAFFMYLLLSYNTSLCIVRQNMAASVTLLSIAFLLQKKYIQFFALAIIACSIHNSNILFLAPILLLYVAKEKLTSYKYMIGIVIAILSVYVLYAYFLVFFGNIIEEMYMERLDGNSDKNSGGILSAVLNALLIFIPFIFYKKNKCRYVFALLAPIFALLFILMGRQAAYFGRMAIPYAALIPISNAIFLYKKKFFLFGIILIAFALWYALNVLHGGYETYPYIVDKNWNL